MAHPDLEIRGGGGVKGGPKNFFWTAPFGLEIREGEPSPGSAHFVLFPRWPLWRGSSVVNNYSQPTKGFFFI